MRERIYIYIYRECGREMDEYMKNKYVYIYIYIYTQNVIFRKNSFGLANNKTQSKRCWAPSLFSLV